LGKITWSVASVDQVENTDKKTEMEKKYIYTNKKKASKEEKLVISPEGAVRVSLAGREWRDGGGRVHGHPTDRRESHWN
jgi:hypothetical protein